MLQAVNKKQQMTLFKLSQQTVLFFKIYKPQYLCSPMILQGRQFYIHLLLQPPLWLRLCNSSPFDLLVSNACIHQNFPLLQLGFAMTAHCKSWIFISTFYHDLFEHFKTHESTVKTLSLFCSIFSGQKWDLKVKLGTICLQEGVHDYFWEAIWFHFIK